MKKSIIYIAAFALTSVMTLNSCIKEIDPQSDSVTADQVTNAPGAYDNFVASVTSSLNGSFFYSGSDQWPFDYGYPSFFIQRDVMGQDIVIQDSGSEWYETWYMSGTGLGPTYAVCQMPWSYYYSWIKNCNNVIATYKQAPDPKREAGLGIAYAMRAMFYMDLARMYAQKTYTADPNAETVPIVKEDNDFKNPANPRATNTEIFKFILDDLDLAEKYIANYKRSNKFTPDLSVVKGLKARAYLTMGKWEDAEKNAHEAAQGYTVMTDAELLSKTDGFNTPNDSWMFGLTFRSTDPNITANDADSSWGSQMIIEVSGSGCGYASNYIGPKSIDAHLFSTIPESDSRRMWFLAPSVDEEIGEATPETTAGKNTISAALEAYTDDPLGVYNTCYNVSAAKACAYAELKFRPLGGEHNNQYTAFTVAVPLMRVEEMLLIEAEAAGMQDEARGKTLLETFAKQRDPNFVYGTHNEAYGNTTTSAFQNEVWWQRRVELWGEGFATFDIKRLQKGIIRSYEGTNHLDQYQWNTETVPQWMNLCIVQSETNNNPACTNNPTPIAPQGNSTPHTW